MSTPQLEILASKLHGYVGADIMALCKEAGIKAIRRFHITTSLVQDVNPSELCCIFKLFQITLKDHLFLLFTFYFSLSLSDMY